MVDQLVTIFKNCRPLLDHFKEMVDHWERSDHLPPIGRTILVRPFEMVDHFRLVGPFEWSTKMVTKWSTIGRPFRQWSTIFDKWSTISDQWSTIFDKWLTIFKWSTIGSLGYADGFDGVQAAFHGDPAGSHRGPVGSHGDPVVSHGGPVGFRNLNIPLQIKLNLLW